MRDTTLDTPNIDYSGCHVAELMKAMHHLRSFERAVQAVPINAPASQVLRGQITVEIDTIREHLESMHGIQIGRPTDV